MFRYLAEKAGVRRRRYQYTKEIAQVKEVEDKVLAIASSAPGGFRKRALVAVSILFLLFVVS